MQTNTNNRQSMGMLRVPVLDKDLKQLMPTTPARARLLMKNGKASAYRNKLGIFCIILHEDKEPNNQPIALGIDPGSKYEGWSVVGTKDTVLNGMSEAPTWVKENMKQRRDMRKARRKRNCPQRAARCDNRSKKGIPPSIMSRWQAKLNIIKHLRAILPIRVVVIEDIKAMTKTSRRWNLAFSSLEQGKYWFYTEVKKLEVNIISKEGHETKKLRDTFGLMKSTQKNKAQFESHAIDAWVLAASEIGAEQPNWLGIFYWTPIHLNRRQLHYLKPNKGGERRPYGGTRSIVLTRGTLVIHPKFGLTYIGGTMKGRMSLHNTFDGTRATQKARVEDVKILTTIHWRSRLISSNPRAIAGANG